MLLMDLYMINYTVQQAKICQKFWAWEFTEENQCGKTLEGSDQVIYIQGC